MWNTPGLGAESDARTRTSNACSEDATAEAVDSGACSGRRLLVTAWCDRRRAHMLPLQHEVRRDAEGSSDLCAERAGGSSAAALAAELKWSWCASPVSLVCYFLSVSSLMRAAVRAEDSGASQTVCFKHNPAYANLCPRVAMRRGTSATATILRRVVLYLHARRLFWSRHCGSYCISMMRTAAAYERCTPQTCTLFPSIL